MSTSNKMKSYEAQAKITVLASLSVMAKDLDEALLKAKELKEGDFVDILGEHMDGDFQLTGVYTSAGISA